MHYGRKSCQKRPGASKQVNHKRNLPENTQKTGQAKRSGGRRSTSWKPGQSGNPNGAPRKGLSWKELIAFVGDEELPGGMTRKEALVRAAFVYAMKGNAVLFRELMQRSEPQAGEVNVHHDWRELAREYGLSETEVLAEAERIVNESHNGASGPEPS